jgi:hypothetical protein
VRFVKSAGLLPHSKRACAGNVGTVLRPSPRPAALAGLAVVGAPHSWCSACTTTGFSVPLRRLSTEYPRVNPFGTEGGKSSSIGTGGTPRKAAMRRILVALTGIMLCGATHGNAVDPTLPPQGKTGSAAVTDLPEITDMSYADPKTWHRLPPAARMSDQVLVQALELPVRFSSRPRPF